MITYIAHLADIHVRKTTSRNEEYIQVFENLIKSLKKQVPDRIVIVGDLFHDFLSLESEQLILINDLLIELSRIAPVRITRGNHDYRKKSPNRKDSIEAIVKLLNNPNIVYYKRTGFYVDENITWVVWHHGDSKNNPWKTKDGKKELTEKDSKQTYIDLFHDPISGCKSTTNFEMKSKSYYNIDDFKGDLSFFGDIHKQQYLDSKHTKAYSGSLIEQDFSEGDGSFHGYLIWDVTKKNAEEVYIQNEHSFKNIRISQYIDFDDLEIEIPFPTKYMKVRFVWATLPNMRNKDNERKIIKHVKDRFDNVIISHKNEFIEVDKIDVKESVTLQNVSDKGVQEEIFKEYLSKIGVEDKVINEVLALDEEILNEVEITEDKSIDWNIIKFGGKNFMSYEELDLDWRNMEGLFQISGGNTFGKTTIIKLISYILFGKTLETESRVKFGDMRFVNNRNNAKSCEGYLVIEANGEYYGIKRKTEITKNKGGEINGAPTTLNYFLLANPDDEMTIDNAIENLNEDQRKKTQLILESIIGNYDNFNRIVFTTSDTLNRILSNDMAVFIDSLLFDSGLDIFDKKLEGFKLYEKRIKEKPRVSCNIETTTEQIKVLNEEISALTTQASNLEMVTLPDIKEKIVTGKKYIETLTKKLFKIDPEIYNLKVDNVKESISGHNKTISDLNARKAVIETNIVNLKETYDSERLKVLLEKKDANKTNEYNSKLIIKGKEQSKIAEEHAIEIINGDIFRHKNKGSECKKQIQDLKDSKTCSQCGQQLTAEHQVHITEKIKSIEQQMFSIADDIKTWETVNKKKHQDAIAVIVKDIETIKQNIETASLEMEDDLKEIGLITNDKNDVEKRKEFQNELDNIPTKIQNEELKINILQQKIINYENSLKQIEENKKIQSGIEAAQIKLSGIEANEDDEKENLLLLKSSIGDKLFQMKSKKELIVAFKAQESHDNIMSLYKKCVHRDGIPRQMLVNYIIPKINVTLENILSVAPFKVYLDLDDLKPKLFYNDRPTSIVDCISASGKERTFSSIVLKFALNQINVKAKPTIFLLDEVMGKLDENGIEEFVEILQLIKTKMNKVLIIEHHANVNPDYLISVQLDENGISSLSIE